MNFEQIILWTKEYNVLRKVEIRYIDNATIDFLASSLVILYL